MRLALTHSLQILTACNGLDSLTGFPAEDWLSGRVALADRIHPEDRELGEALLSPNLSPPSGSINLRLRHADGRIRCLRANYLKGAEPGSNAAILELVLSPLDAAASPALQGITEGLRALMDHTSDYMYLTTPDHLYIGATRAMSGLLTGPGSEANFTGKTVYDLYPEPLADALYRRDSQVLGEGRSTHEIQRVDLPDGSHRWIDNRKYPLKTPDGEVVGLLGICPDITQPIDASHQLGESRELLQLFIEHAPAALAMLDRDMHYIAASRRWLRDFELQSEEVIGHSHYEVFPEIPDRWKALHRRAMAGEDLYSDEDRFVRADCSIQWLRWEMHPWRTADGAIGGILIFAEDITQQKKDKEQLRLAASVFTNAREGILICDPKGAILDVNDMFTRITGYSRAEVLGRNPRILKSGRQSEAFYSDMWRSLLENGRWSGEIWNKTKDGRVFPELLTISAVYDRSSKVQHYVALFSDITQSKEQERELERMAHFDALTSLPNRALLSDRLQQAIVQAHQRGQTLAVACIDLDGFRSVNENYGQEAGDRLLMTVARRMKQALRDADTLGPHRG